MLNMGQERPYVVGGKVYFFLTPTHPNDNLPNCCKYDGHLSAPCPQADQMESITSFTLQVTYLGCVQDTCLVLGHPNMSPCILDMVKVRVLEKGPGKLIKFRGKNSPNPPCAERAFTGSSTQTKFIVYSFYTQMNFQKPYMNPKHSIVG